MKLALRIFDAAILADSAVNFPKTFWSPTDGQLLKLAKKKDLFVNCLDDALFKMFIQNIWHI